MIGWSFPYSSQRMPVVARNVVATSQPLATQAGVDALRSGGNAVDAALAAAITLTVVEPNNNGVGSDAFALVWDGSALHGLNASGRSPAAWSLARFAGHSTMPSLGWDTVTVPGAVSAWVTLSARFGRLPFGTLFESAIRYAERGFHVGPKTAHYWDQLRPRYAAFPDFCAHFLPDGRAPAPGELFRRPDLAGTLAHIAETRGEAFYRGDLAAAMVEHARQHGGVLALDDLAQQEPEWVAPVEQPYRDVALHEIPPNGQGLATQIALGILAHLRAHELDTEECTHAEIEAMKIGIRAAFDHIADPHFMRAKPQDLLRVDRLAALAEGVGPNASDVPPAVLPVSRDTVCLATGDEDGMMVSFIQSNYQAFGSGIVIPGTGIALQNRGRGFSLDAGHPNCVAGGKRPFHTIIPGFVTEDGRAKLAFGVMGGHMQHQGHVQMVRRIFDHGQNPQAASDAPRWHVYEDFSVGLEPGFPGPVADALRARGHRVRFDATESLFGGAQLVYRLADGYCAASDHRKEGAAAGF